MARRRIVGTDKRVKRQAGGGADHGPGERRQHGAGQLVSTEAAGVFALQMQGDSLLDRLAARGLIADHWRQAGLQLQQDYLAGRVASLTAAAYGSPRAGKSGGTAEAEQRLLRGAGAEAAYRRWRSAVAAVPAGVREAVIDLCCCDLLPKAAVLGKVPHGLAALARHYRL